MRRYYAHFTIIYPTIYLKNIVVEVDCRERICSLIPFDIEIEKTEFYSGHIYLIPSNISIDQLNIDCLKTELEISQINDVVDFIDSTISYHIYDDNLSRVL